MFYNYLEIKEILMYKKDDEKNFNMLINSINLNEK